MTTSYRLNDIKEIFDGTIVRDGTFRSLAFVSDAKDHALVFVEDDRFAARLDPDKVSCAIAPPELTDSVPMQIGLAISAEPRRRFYEVNNHLTETGFFRQDFDNEIDATAMIHPRAIVADRNVRIGPGCRIGAGACIEEFTDLEGSVEVCPGAAVGVDGLCSYVFGAERLDIAHSGGVRIGAGSKLFANGVIARGIFGNDTVIGGHVRIGITAFVSHNVRIGDRTIISGGSNISGFVEMGSDVWIGPGVTLSNRIAIGCGARVSLGAVVIGDVAENGHVSGNFAEDHRSFMSRRRRLLHVQRRD